MCPLLKDKKTTTSTPNHVCKYPEEKYQVGGKSVAREFSGMRYAYFIKCT